MFSTGIDQRMHNMGPSHRVQMLAPVGDPMSFEPPPLTSKMEQRGDRKFKILSIDGGGIRGIIPLKILTELERHIGPIGNTFDLIAGTSTGGFIALALTGAHSQLKASDILQLYQTRAREIFLPNPNRKWPDAAMHVLPHLSTAKHMAQALIDHPLYTNAGLCKLTAEICGERFMKDTSTNVLIPAVNVTNIKKPTTTLFSNRDRDHALLAIQDVACATSAAPTYFPYKRLAHSTYVDGGLACNNPAQESFFYGLRNGVSIESQHVLSLGTGFADIEGIGPEAKEHNHLYWAKRIFPTISATQNMDIDRNLRGALGDRYWRIDPGIEREISLDDHAPNTLRELNEIGNALVDNQRNRIREIAKILRSGPENPGRSAL